MIPARTAALPRWRSIPHRLGHRFHGYCRRNLMNFSRHQLQFRVAICHAAVVRQRHPTIQIRRLFIARHRQHVIRLPIHILRQIGSFHFLRIRSAIIQQSTPASAGCTDCPANPGSDRNRLPFPSQFRPDFPYRPIVVRKQQRFRFRPFRRAGIFFRAHQSHFLAHIFLQQLLRIEQIVFVVLLDHAQLRRLGQRPEMHRRGIDGRGHILKMQWKYSRTRDGSAARRAPAPDSSCKPSPPGPLDLFRWSSKRMSWWSARLFRRVQRLNSPQISHQQVRLTKNVVRMVVPNTFRVRKDMGFRLPESLLPSLNVVAGFSCRVNQDKFASIAGRLLHLFQLFPPSLVENLRPSIAVTVAVNASVASTRIKSVCSGGLDRFPMRAIVVRRIVPFSPTSQQIFTVGAEPADDSRARLWIFRLPSRAPVFRLFDRARAPYHPQNLRIRRLNLQIHQVR